MEIQQAANSEGGRGTQIERDRFRPGQTNGSWRRNGTEQRAMALGWFSLALGAAELIAPHTMATVAGARPRRDTAKWVRLMGAREFANGLGILSQTSTPTWLWARVIGDAIDIALLGRVLADPRGNRTRALTSLASIIGITAVDVKSAMSSTREASNADEDEQGISVSETITVNRGRDEVYRFWRKLENLPQFMAHLESVVEQGNGRSKWTAKGPMGTSVEWEAELLADQPGEYIAWRSCGESDDVDNHGSVKFLDGPGKRGTEICVELRYDPPAGAIGATVAKLFGEEPSQQIAGDLRRFKQVIETGEVVHSDASIHRGMHPARPSASSFPQSPSLPSLGSSQKSKKRSSKGEKVDR